ncbi:MAG: sodium-dependent transporter [Gammaproteobacteria bacterium AqS3]|nr:sodium-dependent transporter [Gammaproteobacteria bacterium AqS3]
MREEMTKSAAPGGGSDHPVWHGRWTLLMAATGSAVGLGNIWKFPYITGENGGAAFVLIYIVFVLVLGVPLMLGELGLGRSSRKSPLSTIMDINRERGLPKGLDLAGWIPQIGSISILTFYSVIAGWSLLYILYSLMGVFSGIDAAGSEEVFTGLLGSAGVMILGHTVFMALTAFIIARGAVAGIARSIGWLMPLLLTMVVIMLGYSMFSGEFARGVAYLFTPDFSKVTPAAISEALGHAFFSLSLGMGAIMVYGSYMQNQENIPVTGTTVSLLDMVLALGMGLVVFPVVFAYGLEPSAGPGLIFQSVPLAMGNLPLGDIFNVVFFSLVAFAALSSSISLLEPTVAMIEERVQTSRPVITVIVAGGTWLVGIAAALSFNHWDEIKIFGAGIFDALDFVSGQILLPLGGLVVAVWSGWYMNRSAIREQLVMSDALFSIWEIAVRYVTPLLIVLVMLGGLGIISF